jgi:thiosulfate/3-mercaptopyruvate sulfurtransferase
MLAGFFCCLAIVCAHESYPRTDLLLEPSELEKQTKTTGWVVLDVRGSTPYEAGHVPGAIVVSAGVWAKEFQDGKNVEGWSRRIGDLGIQRDTKVVVYDDASSKDSARAWWILKYWGIRDVRLLNGQWAGWKAAGLPISREIQNPHAAAFQALPDAKRLARKEDVLRDVEQKSSQIVDARTESEHLGKMRLARRAGCIPGSTNLDWVQLVEEKTQRFKSAAELRELFEKHGIDLTKPLTAHCQSGGRSSVLSFALELLGATQVRNYHASWMEWGNAGDTPVQGPSQ